MARLERSFFVRSAREVARELLGLELVCSLDGSARTLRGRIVETEAYEGPEDLASHSARGRRTARNETMFGPPGRAYVYLIYGMHHCFNVVTAPVGIPHAVLLRALEPLSPAPGSLTGPGRLARTLGIERGHDGLDLLRGPLRIERPAPSRYVPPDVRSSPRIGLGAVGAWAEAPLRFYDARSTHVSGPKRRGVDR
jgi:DNA-3-methyladenine glycosylase